jgi:hypothetical protein
VQLRLILVLVTVAALPVGGQSPPTRALTAPYEQFTLRTD